MISNGAKNVGRRIVLRNNIFHRLYIEKATWCCLPVMMMMKE